MGWLSRPSDIDILFEEDGSFDYTPASFAIASLMPGLTIDKLCELSWEYTCDTRLKEV